MELQLSFLSHSRAQHGLSRPQLQCPSQSTLVSSEESSLLLFLLPQSVSPPANGCHEQHHYADTQQCHRHHFGLEQRVKGERHPGTSHADHQGNHTEREHAAIPGLLCPTCGLGKSLQRGERLWRFGLTPSNTSLTVSSFPTAIQTLVLVLTVLGQSVGLTAVAAVQVRVKDRGWWLSARGAAHLRAAVLEVREAVCWRRPSSQCASDDCCC